MFKIVSFETVTSTQDIAREYPPFHVITADRQTKGRGRHGRIWESEKGNLMATFVFPKISDVFFLHASILKICKNLLKGWMPYSAITIKAPNDILVDKKKIMGILLEHNNDYLLVGIGMNITHAPASIDQPATFLENHNVFYTKMDVVKNLCTAFEVCV